ncbi:MAG TPA: adenylate/guanylate cyclase domain-containing protein, partial [bacterium]|nr:adenylate/guanylate cyclase domain-containing protein [bacterium]
MSAEFVSRLRAGAAVGLLAGATFASLLLLRMDTLQRLELALVDTRFRLFPDATHVSPEIEIVTIDDATLVETKTVYGYGWPIPRARWREIVEDVAAAHPKVIVLDVAFEDPAETIENFPPVSQDPSGTLARFDSPAWNPFGRPPSGTQDNISVSQAEMLTGTVVLGVFAQSLDRVDAKTGDAEKARRRILVGDYASVLPYLDARLPRTQASAPVPSFPSNATSEFRLRLPEPNILAGARAVGLVSTETTTDADGTIRRFAPLLHVDDRSTAIQVLGISAFAVARAAPASESRQHLSDVPPVIAPWPALPAIENAGGTVRILDRAIPVASDGAAWIRWRGHWDRDPLLAAHVHPLWRTLAEADDALTPRAPGDPAAARPHPHLDALRDKIVVLGLTAQGDLADITGTPFGKQPGVYMQAAVLDTVLTGAFVRAPTMGVNALLVLLLSLLAGTATVAAPELRAPRRHAALVLATLLFPGLLIAAGWAAASLAAFHAGWIVDTFHVEAGIVFAASLGGLLGWMRHQRREDEFRGLLVRTFGDDVADDLIVRTDAGELPLGRAETRTLTVYFSDIAGFTTISEKLPPDQLVGILNEYLSRVTELFVKRYGAYVDKYIGDAVMASWGAPRPCEDGPIRACNAALDAVATMDAFSAELVARGLPPLRTRIGINTGPAVAGWIGHASKIAFTSLGDTVNLASRLEGANKHYGTTIMIGPEAAAQAKDAFLLRELDLVKVKGKHQPVRVFELMGRALDALPGKREIKRRYEAALALFRARSFE